VVKIKFQLIESCCFSWR